MNRHTFSVITAALAFVLALTMAVAAAGRRAPEAAPPGPPAPATPAAPPGQAAASAEYAGQATCQGCHDDRSYAGTKHGHAFNERTPAANLGCESCHGPGRAHAESGDSALIRRFSVMPPSEVSETCMSCHNRAEHALWDGSQHDQRNLSCVTCHSVHAPQGAGQIKAKTQMALCSSCHRNVTNRQHRFTHMPVREGAMTCTSCHNPHGSTNVKLLRAGTTVDESCTSCHADKRGPYLWEHAPVTESCVTCHEPHGSNNERLLVSKVPFLCQRCHVTSRHPPTVYDGYVLNNTQNANKLTPRGCVICHQQIHGSNAPSGKAFLR